MVGVASSVAQGFGPVVTASIAGEALVPAGLVDVRYGFLALVILGVAGALQLLVWHRRRVDAVRRRGDDLCVAILGTVRDLVIVLDRQGRVVRINGVCAALIGFTFEEVRGRRVQDLFLPPGEGARVEEIFAQLASGACLVRCTQHWRTRHGEQHQISWVYSALLHRTGVIDCVVGVGVDITRQGCLAAALAASEARCRSLVEVVPLGMAGIDGVGRLLWCNHTFRAILGHDEGQVLRLVASDIPHSADYPEGVRLFRELCAGIRPEYRLEKGYQHADGRAIWVSLSVAAICATDGKFDHAVVILEDITARKAVEGALREEEARSRAIFATGAIGIACVDLQGRIVESNAMLRSFLGRDAGELRGAAIEGFSLTDDASPGWPLFREVLAGSQRESRWEGSFLRKDGRPVWGRVIASLVQVAPAVAPFVLVTVEDISRLKAAEAKLSQFESGLSAQEWRVLSLLAAPDLTYARIGALLHISPETVKTHVHHIAGKLGVAGRREILAAARCRGLLGTPGGPGLGLENIPGELTENPPGVGHKSSSTGVARPVASR